MAVRQFESGQDRRKRVLAGQIPRTRVYGGELMAEIIMDRRSNPPIVHCVVQRQGSPEILLLEQFYSKAAAERTAYEFIASFGRKAAKGKPSAA